MRIATITVVMAFAAALTGCVSPRSFAPGSSMVDVFARAGPPTDIRFDRNGDELWEYATGPEGFETYHVRFGSEGKVKEVTQLLTEDQLMKVVPGKMTQTDVRNLLGRPFEEVTYMPGLTWSWRFLWDGVQPDG